MTRQNRVVFERALEADARVPKLVQVGRVNYDLWVEPFITLRLANEVGSSGSPVFARRSDRVIGMLSAGGGNADALARPLGPILEKIATQRASIADPAWRRAVDRLLATHRIAQPPQAQPTPGGVSRSR